MTCSDVQPSCRESSPGNADGDLTTVCNSTLTTLQDQNNCSSDWNRLFWVFFCVVFVGFVGCRKPDHDEPTHDVAAAVVPEISLRQDNSGLAFRFLDRASGKMRTVGSVADVPEEVRSAVLVFDTNAPPAPPEVLYVANLTKANEDGSYPYEIRNRFEYERRTAPTPSGSGAAVAVSSAVTIYSAEWCGACKQAKAWMKNNNVPFVERDVEKDPKAMDDLRKDAEKAGKVFESIAGRVPVIVAKDQLMTGFDANSLKKILGLP